MAIVKFGPRFNQAFTDYNYVRAATFSILGGVAVATPADTIRKYLNMFIYLVGPIAYGLSFTLTRLVHRQSGRLEFYEVCATILPILLIGMMIEGNLFEHANMSPFWIFVNLDLLATGLGASLLAVAGGHGSSGLFAATVGGMIDAFAIIVAVAMSKPPIVVTLEVSKSALAHFSESIGDAVRWCRKKCSPPNVSIQGCSRLAVQAAVSMAGSGSHGLPLRAVVTASSAVRPWDAAESR